MPDVFISHATDDRLDADTLCAVLERHALTCWIAPRDIPTGAVYAEAILEGIGESRCLVLVLSRASNDSPHVHREVERAAARHLPIFPVRVDDAPLAPALEYFLSQHQWSDARSEPIGTVADRLAGDLVARLAQTDAARADRPTASPATEPVPGRERPGDPEPQRGARRPVQMLLLALVIAVAGVSLTRLWWGDAPSGSADRPRWRAFAELRASGVASAGSEEPTADGGLPLAEGERVLVGVTLWRVIPAVGPAAGARRLRHRTDSRLTAERISLGTALRVGENIRLGIEIGRPGFLYIVDRELRRDGTRGPAFLIFPTRSIDGGRNEVRPGRVVEIPNQRDDPPYFELEDSTGEQVAEEISLIVSARPLTGFSIDDEALQVRDDLLERWERDWLVEPDVEERGAPTGVTYTEAEGEAGESRSRLLRHGDPLPETLLEATSRDRDAVMVRFLLTMER